MYSIMREYYYNTLQLRIEYIFSIYLVSTLRGQKRTLDITHQ